LHEVFVDGTEITLAKLLDDVLGTKDLYRYETESTIEHNSSLFKNLFELCEEVLVELSLLYMR